MRVWLIILIVLCCGKAQAQQSFDVVFCDVDNLYDTIPSPFYDDSDYTPDGRLRWDTSRYCHKVESVARLIDSMAIPVVALWGVENEQVVRDVVESTQGDYAYLHRTHDYSDGLDFALLYYGDYLFPEHVTSWRGALCVEAVANGRKIALIVNHRCSSLGVLIDERDLLRRGYSIVVLGTPNANNLRGLGLKDHTVVAERAGRGNVERTGGWSMRDRIASTWQGEVRCDVYAAHWLITPQGYPRATYEGKIYHGGVGAYLPIFAQFFQY